MPATPHPLERFALHLGWLAPVCWIAVLAVFALLWPQTASAPLGKLCAPDAPGAAWFNALGLMVPGGMLFGFTLGLERAALRDGAGRALRLGTGMLMIATLAFAAQGVFPFDPSEPDGADSQRHAALLGLALLGQIAAAVTLVAGLWRRPGWRALALAGLVLGAALAGLLVWPAQEFLPFFAARAGLAQRLVLALWFAWFPCAAAVALRRQG